jgi:hypothetical protein
LVSKYYSETYRKILSNNHRIPSFLIVLDKGWVKENKLIKGNRLAVLNSGKVMLAIPSDSDLIVDPEKARLIRKFMVEVNEL